SLINRGSITFWFSNDVIDQWNSKKRSGKRGRPTFYSNEAILCALMIKYVYRLTYRATQSYLESLIQLMGLTIPCPDYSLICRRASKVQIPLPRLQSSEPLHVVFDSTGLKVYGEGEWKVRKHGYSKRRTWRKVHISMCAQTQQILVVAMTSNDVSDESVMPDLLDQITEPIATVGGYGAYDVAECYGAIFDAGGSPRIPPRRNARKNTKGDIPIEPRNQAIARIKELGGGEEGRNAWKKEIGYHKRSLVETAMYRIKTIFGDKLTSRKSENQSTEVFIKCAALNKMTALGIPESYQLAS
ncbi:MAG: IS5 family transposase, partial [Chlamydiia bacterium]|nr:IS5 family transposase [Chlamydiia bacterium]